MKEFIKALNSIAEEKKVDKKIVIEAMNPEAGKVQLSVEDIA